MRIISVDDGGTPQAGIVIGEEVVDVGEFLRRRDLLPESARGLTVEDFLAFPDWRQLAEEAARGAPSWRLQELAVGPVVTRPRNVFVVAANTGSHLKEAGLHTEGMAPVRPVVLAKSPGALIGPRDAIVHPAVSEKVDYEAELGVVIGKAGRNIPESAAMEHVAGYTVTNDVSARDYQMSEWEDNTFYRTHYLGKSFDTFCPCDSSFVTVDEVRVLADHIVRCWVNDELRQEEKLQGLYFSVQHVVSFISSVMTLYPGDLILMGTPAGVGAFADPPAFLAPGDIVTCEIDGIGRITNPVVAEQAAR